MSHLLCGCASELELELHDELAHCSMSRFVVDHENVTSAEAEASHWLCAAQLLAAWQNCRSSARPMRTEFIQKTLPSHACGNSSQIVLALLQEPSMRCSRLPRSRSPPHPLSGRQLKAPLPGQAAAEWVLWSCGPRRRRRGPGIRTRAGHFQVRLVGRTDAMGRVRQQSMDENTGQCVVRLALVYVYFNRLQTTQSLYIYIYIYIYTCISIPVYIYI